MPSSDRLVPALARVLREGYTFNHLKRDALAGLTVAIVALPLSMAIAIASGGTPAMGLYTAIVGGFFISALGGSRFQIGGPAGAFIVLVAATVHDYGIAGMMLATMMAGVMMGALGLFRLGSYIRFIPYPVTVGFTSGIAVIIFSSQIKDLLGLTLTGPEPGPLLEKLPVIWDSLPSANPETIALAAVTIALIVGLKRFAPRLPNLLIAVAGTTVAVWALGLNTPTIVSTFGAVPAMLPLPSLPPFDTALALAVLPNAIGFTLLGSIEALLSAVVADGMSGKRHNSNMELLAQGVANIASAIMGGMVATGTIARTATNVRANAHSPVAGMLHAAFILLFMMVAAPLVGMVPLAALAGVLATVAWNMIERHAIATLFRSSRGDAAVVLVTLLLTIFRDLTEAIVVGFSLGAVLFIHRMSKAAEVSTLMPDDDTDDEAPDVTRSDEILIYRIRGAFFFGAAASVGAVLERIADTHRVMIIDFADAALVDSTALHTVEGLVTTASRRNVAVILTGASQETLTQFAAHGLQPPMVEIAGTVQEGVTLARKRLGRPAPLAAELT
ncbi:SulP family inorganic anion transporter [Pararhodobacter zhoushanensis]|uniref:SulP family inorganic anion transporter n=1 Tax=Pararhodobacter zhoushanensis TaxID=2479545 RepID=A0ABT3GVF8_9RHOB|nr:SulP family inorganic anion transporter [Pararhodobacter zhoushanensis]MCW1931516.1 SulP family inorganic anion transporter [Pararhodobacter zhoushanensis]